MDISELEKRITRIEDIEAIKQLKARYCDICDKNVYKLIPNFIMMEIVV